MTFPVTEERSVLTARGYTIQVQAFKKEENTDAVVISSATGVLQRYYHKFAAYLAANGYNSYTFDYEGIGKDPAALRKSQASLSDWAANDQAAVFRYAKSENPEGTLHLITHSIGGQLLGLNPAFQLADSALMIASQSGYWKYYKGMHYPKMWLFWHGMIPLLTPLYGYFPAKRLGLFENLPQKMVYEWAAWGKHPDYMLGIVEKEQLFFKQIRIPIRLLSFPNDIYAPVAAVDWLANAYGTAETERIHIVPQAKGIPEVGHFGFFKESFKSSLWEESLQWLEKHS